jgi:hypothetical protein
MYHCQQYLRHAATPRRVSPLRLVLAGPVTCPPVLCVSNSADRSSTLLLHPSTDSGRINTTAEFVTVVDEDILVVCADKLEIESRHLHGLDPRLQYLLTDLLLDLLCNGDTSTSTSLPRLPCMPSYTSFLILAGNMFIICGWHVPTRSSRLVGQLLCAKHLGWAPLDQHSETT